jgi:membrane-bound lytic murein transglycosylase D
MVIVRSGDTLGAIAQRNGTTIAKLRSANGITGNRIHAGQRLRIPA